MGPVIVSPNHYSTLVYEFIYMLWCEKNGREKSKQTHKAWPQIFKKNLAKYCSASSPKERRKRKVFPDEGASICPQVNLLSFAHLAPSYDCLLPPWAFSKRSIYCQMSAKERLGKKMAKDVYHQNTILKL